MSQPELPILALLGLCGFLFALGIVPTYRRLATRFGLVDAPDGRRKHQPVPIPVVGGLAVFTATCLSLAVMFLTSTDINFMHAVRYDPRLASLLAACILIGMVGVIDDTRGLRGTHKLVGQIFAISILVFPGHIQMSQLSFLGWEIDLGQFGIVITMLWMLGCINAINLIDGMDGLLGIIGTITLMTFGIIAALTNQWFVASISFAMAGALIGFLCFNLPPASVYLGDCGSMMIGLVIGALALCGSLKGSAAVTLSTPIAMLILPIFDTFAAIARRKLTGRSIYATDRGHLHHCLLRRGMNRVRVLMLVTVLSSVTAMGAIATTLWRNELFAVFAAGAVVVTLISTRLFGYAEFLLLKERLRSIAASIRHGNAAERSHEGAVRLQGTAGWNHLWEEVVSESMRLNLRSLRLDVNAPALHEAYHARWDRLGAGGDPNDDWQSHLPLFSQGQSIGRLTAVGIADSEPVWVKLMLLAPLVEHLEQGATILTSALMPTPTENPEIESTAAIGVS